MIFDVAVTGGGPAGIIAAVTAAERGFSSVILEKMDKPLLKLGITGKGRCNITNGCEKDEFINNFPDNGKFLMSSFSSFSNINIIEYFEEMGLRTKTERGMRVFPQSDKAFDVVNVLLKRAKRTKVEIITGCKVNNIIKENEVFKIKTNSKETFCSKNVIIATGGISYPGTGSSGDGYILAKAFGHQVLNPMPSLIPLVSDDSFVKDLMGLSLKNVSVSFYKTEKLLYKDFGEMLFTHFGVSGPVILSGSRTMVKNGFHETCIKIDLKPALDYDTLDNRIINDFKLYGKKQYKNSLGDLLPSMLIPVIIKLSGISEDKKACDITKQERKVLVNLLKEFKVRITGSRPVEEAIVTMGGVNIKEINPGTMESKLVKGLYFAGEVMDIDGYTGGFNLSAAFMTGYTAGRSIN